jgi:hypothetical protein
MTQVVKHDNRLWFREEILSVLHCIKEKQNEYLYWKKVNKFYWKISFLKIDGADYAAFIFLRFSC